MLVVDSSVLFVGLADDGPDGDRVRARLAPEGELVAPDMLDLEVLSVLRRHAAAGGVDPRRAEQVLVDLADLPLRRVPHLQLLPRCWALRGNFTSYDAAYVAVAEMLDLTLLTADRRIARAPGSRCEIELMA